MRVPEIYEGDTTEDVVIGIGVISESDGHDLVFKADSIKDVEQAYVGLCGYDTYYYGFDFYEYGTPEFEKYKEQL